MSESNKALVKRFDLEVWQRGRLEVIDELVSEELEYSVSPLAEFRGAQGVRDYVAKAKAAFPDLHFVVDDLIAEGDKVVERWTMHGTHRGEFLGVPASGKTVTVPGVTVIRFEAGKMADIATVFDTQAMLTQMGTSAVPVTAAGAG